MVILTLIVLWLLAGLVPAWIGFRMHSGQVTYADLVWLLLCGACPPLGWVFFSLAIITWLSDRRDLHKPVRWLSKR